MAKSAGLAQKLFHGVYDISGDVGAITNWSTPVAVLDVTGIDKSATERLQGLVSGEVGFTAYFNDASGAAHAALRAPTAGAPVTWCFGSTVGDTAGMFQGEGLDYSPTRGNDGALTFDVTMDTYTTLPVWGVMLTPGLKTDTGAANGATLDQAAQTTAGAEAQLHVTAFTGSNFTATIQDSSNGSSWGTLVAFTQVTDVGSERVTITGTVDRYVRVISAGTFNPVNFAVSFRRGAATDLVGY